MSKKLIKSLMIISVVAVLGSAVGCSSTNQSSGTAGTVNEKGEKVHKLKVLCPEGRSLEIAFKERDQYPVWLEIQKMLDEANIEIEYELVTNEQYKVVVQTRMAAANLPDIVNISPLDSVTALNLGGNGTIQNLEPLIEQYSDGSINEIIDTYYPFANKLTTAPDGNKYWFTNLNTKKWIAEDKDAPTGITMIIRQDWLNKLGLNVPTNTEDFLAVLKAFKEEDVNGNGAKDEVLICDPGYFGNGIAQWFGLGTGLTSVDLEKKKVVSPWYQEGIKDYFIYLQQLVKEGVLDTTAIGSTGDLVTQKVAENKVSSIYQYGIQRWYEATIEGVDDAQYLPLMPLNAVDGINPAASIEPPDLVWNKYAITKDCKDVEGAIKFFDIIHSVEYMDLTMWGIKDETYVEENGVKRLKEELTTKERGERKNSAGGMLYGDTIFPRLQLNNVDSELMTSPEYKAEYQRNLMNYPYQYPNSISNYLALPNEEQLEKLNKIQNDLSTYSTELATKIALGQESLEDWDSHIAKLKEIGLDEYMEIQQQLLDRYHSID